MRTEGDRESDNVEDQRGMFTGGRGIAAGGIGTVIIALIVMLLGGNPMSLFQGGGGGGAPSQQTAPPPSRQTEDKLTKFVRVVLADTEDVWQVELPRQTGHNYRDPKLVLFTGRVQTACGGGSTASGPFYCPGDEKVYIDLAFYDELARRFKAPGDFAEAYVIAHEVGHHIQRLTGTEARTRGDSVPLELQADCYAGVWGHAAAQPGRAARGLVELDPGDIDAGLRAAAAIGDDRLQRMATGRVMPERFTHGTSAQRVEWFKRGLDSGQPGACDTFMTSSVPLVN